MCEPVSTITAIGSLLGGGAAVHSAINAPKPKPPHVPQAEKQPTIDGFRRRNKETGPGAYGSQRTSLLTSPATTASTKLGQ